MNRLQLITPMLMNIWAIYSLCYYKHSYIYIYTFIRISPAMAIRVCSLAVVCRLLTAVAYPVVEHGL